MEKGRALLRWGGILLVFAAVLGMCIEARGEKEVAKAPDSGRLDRLKIDTLAAYQKLELPPVTIFHDKHTDALLKEKKSCETCHPVVDKKLSFNFMRTNDTKPGEIKGIYHKYCISCHMDMATAGKASGPPDGLCRSCHNAEPQPPAARLVAGLDKVLHFRHVESKSIPALTTSKENCAVCHHVYDQKAKKVMYVKGQEGTCGYCHKAQPQKGVTHLGQVSHQECVLCHLELAQKGIKENVPVRCNDCHSVKAQAQIAKNNQVVVAKLKNPDILRIKRGQPDATMITYDAQFKEKLEKALLMNPVLFNHKHHETSSNSCKVCHHASIEACSKCHTLGGAKDGNFVTFEQAMHSQTSNHSCIGCHAAQQAAPNCFGCHRMVGAWRQDKMSCKQCHMAFPGNAPAKGVLNPGQKTGMAETLLKSRIPTTGTYPMNEIPEKVVIKDLTDKYQPVEMSHRQHVELLLKGMKDSRLAQYFHRDPSTLCQGCHHHSPSTKKPPQCANCHPKTHGQASITVEATRPSLLAALHGQCMSCHKEMKVKPVATACTECHLERKK